SSDVKGFEMKLPRRRFLHLAAGAAALPFAPHVARAQAYPTRPVRIIVGFPAGGGTDTLARLIGHWLSERLGKPFIVENRPGAASNIATEAVVRAPADGFPRAVAAVRPDLPRHRVRVPLPERAHAPRKSWGVL